MKKFAIGILSAAIILGAGTAVFAAGNSESGDALSFEKMFPLMQKMHPNSSKEELQNMYKACHESGGTNEMDMGSKNMMNRF